MRKDGTAACVRLAIDYAAESAACARRHVPAQRARLNLVMCQMTRMNNRVPLLEWVEDPPKNALSF